MKQCRKCQENKNDAEFYRHGKTKDGLQAYCKSCSKEIVKKYADENKTKMSKTYRKSRFRYRYGIEFSEEDWNALLDRQGGGCAICGTTESLCLDHCHARIQVRGILCRTCNVGLGMFKDNPAFLKAAAKYLS